MHFEISLRLQDVLDKTCPDTSTADLAKAFGMAEPTVSHYLKDRWTQVDRGLLEKFADFTQCEVAELFKISPSPFFEAFIHLPVCNFVYHDEKDKRSVQEAIDLVKRCAPNTQTYEWQDAIESEFLEFAKENCVVIGSPRGNPASQHALHHTFLKPGPRNVVPSPPFRFQWHSKMNPPHGAFGTVNDQATGIWCTTANKLVAADFIPSVEDFDSKWIKTGRDCAVVVVSKTKYWFKLPEETHSGGRLHQHRNQGRCCETGQRLSRTGTAG